MWPAERIDRAKRGYGHGAPLLPMAAPYTHSMHALMPIAAVYAFVIRLLQCVGKRLRNGVITGQFRTGCVDKTDAVE